MVNEETLDTVKKFLLKASEIRRARVDQHQNEGLGVSDGLMDVRPLLTNSLGVSALDTG